MTALAFFMKSMKTDGGHVGLLLDSHKEENFMVARIIIKKEHTDKYGRYDILSVERLIFNYSFSNVS